MKRTASDAKRSSASSRKGQPKREATVTLALCVKKDDDCGDLRVATLYPILRDREAAQEGMLRVVDDSGEDYLYPREYFQRIRLKASVARTMKLSPAKASST